MKIIGKFFCVIILALTVLGTNTMLQVDAAGNYSDTSYRFIFGEWQPYSGWKTEKRAKRDDTSSYMSCNSAQGYSYTAKVCASNNPNDEWATDVGSPSYRFYSGYTFYMINYVYEKGYSYATIKAQPDGNANFTATGVWSPDSI